MVLSGLDFGTEALAIVGPWPDGAWACATDTTIKMATTPKHPQSVQDDTRSFMVSPSSTGTRVNRLRRSDVRCLIDSPTFALQIAQHLEKLLGWIANTRCGSRSGAVAGKLNSGADNLSPHPNLGYQLH